MSSRNPNPNPAGAPEDLSVWVVRGGREHECRVEENLEEGVVAVAWGDWIADADAFGFADRDALDRDFNERFAAEHCPNTRRRGREELLRFRDKVQIGHLVVMPWRDRGAADATISIGKVTGPAEFDGARPPGARLRRRVTWLAREVPVSAIWDDLRRSIRITQLTVFEPGATNAASRVLHLATHGRDPEFPGAL